MRKPSLNALIGRYIKARAHARMEAKWGLELPSYIEASRASMAAFDACVECCAGQPTVLQTIEAFKYLEAVRTE